MMLLKSNSFGKGLGLQVQIRTTGRRAYSYIESAAIRIGDDTLEVGSWGDYFFNGVARASPKDMAFAGLYRIEQRAVSNKQQRFEISLGPNNEKMIVSTMKDMVNVRVEKASAETGERRERTAAYTHVWRWG